MLWRHVKTIHSNLRDIKRPHAYIYVSLFAKSRITWIEAEGHATEI